MTSLLEVEGLTKRFGPKTVVDDISFSVDRGHVLGFLGPNGAGKTTTMRMVCGFLEPTSGTARIAGFDIVTDPVKAKLEVGYLPEGAPSYGEMTVGGFLRFIGRMRSLQGTDLQKRIDMVVDKLQLSVVIHDSIETLSKGFKRRVGIAQALLADPQVLILDEPTDGLDPNQKHQVRELLKAMADDKAIIVSTHILEEVDAVCTRAIVVDQGRIVADGTPEDLQAKSTRHNAVAIRLPSDKLTLAEGALGKVESVRAIEPIGKVNGVARLRVVPSDGRDILPEVRSSIDEAGIAVDEIYLERGRLDDVFRQLTTAA